MKAERVIDLTFRMLHRQILIGITCSSEGTGEPASMLIHQCRRHPCRRLWFL